MLAGEHQATVTLKSHGFSRTLLAWSPYLFLVKSNIVAPLKPKSRSYRIIEKL